MSEKEKKELQLEIQLDEETAQGVYANMAVVNHNESEFVIDFVFVQPQAPRAKVRSRVVTSPGHVRRLIRTLEENLARYEAHLAGPEGGEVTEASDKAGHFH